MIDSTFRHALIVSGAVLAVAVLAGVSYYLWKRRPFGNSGSTGADSKRGRLVVWAAALGASAVLAVVVVFTQVPFYEGLFGRDAQPLWWLPVLNLVYLTPVALESLAWVFSVMAVFAVFNDKPSGRYERMMWAFSAVAAAVNAGHNISTGKAVTGLVLGGFSIAGPLLVHFALRWDRDAQSERSTDEFRKAALARATLLARRTAQVFRHPVTSWRTVSIATNLGCRWDQAYRIALLGQYTAVKNVLRAQFEQSLPNPDASTVHDASAGAPGDAIGPVGEDIFPACTDPLIADLHAVQDPGALFALWGVHDPGALDAPSHNTVVPNPDGEPAPEAPEPPRDAPSARREVKRNGRKRARRSRVVRAHAGRQEHIAARHWWECTNSGLDPRARPRREVAEELGINITAISRGFKMAESGEFPNPNGEA